MWNVEKFLMFFAHQRKIFSDLWGLVGRRMLHPQWGGSICGIFASLEMPPHSLSCWHCSPDNEDEGWYYWQHSEAGKDQLIILHSQRQILNLRNTFVMRLKKHFQLQSSLQEWDSNKCPAVKWVLLFNFEYIFGNMTNDSYSEMFYCSGPILRD